MILLTNSYCYFCSQGFGLIFGLFGFSIFFRCLRGPTTPKKTFHSTCFGFWEVQKHLKKRLLFTIFERSENTKKTFYSTFFDFREVQKHLKNISFDFLRFLRGPKTHKKNVLFDFLRLLTGPKTLKKRFYSIFSIFERSKNT